MLLNIFRVVISNFFIMSSSIIIGFILPLILSVEAYGEYRLFIFYLTYIGIFHLGFVDAIYIKYGGMREEDINIGVYKKEHNIFYLYQVTITIFICFVSYLIRNNFLFLLSLAILPLNIGSFYKLFYQATGQFKKYGFINIMQALISLIMILILVLLGNKNSDHYITITILSYVFLLIIMEIDFFKYTKGKKAYTKLSVIQYNKIGIFILIGNFFVILISNFSGWIVEFYLKSKDFAHYSFAMSMMNIVLMVVSAISLTFYNYIAKKEDHKVLMLTKEILLIIGVFAGIVYFPLDFLVKKYFVEYVHSLDFIVGSFIMFPYIIVINVIVINLYKARKQERKYFKVVFFILLINVSLNIISFLLYKSIVSLAYATLLTYVLWYVYSAHYAFKFLKSSDKELIYLLSHFITFIICTNYFNWINGLVIYFIILLILTLILFNDIFRKIILKLKYRKIINER